MGEVAQFYFKLKKKVKKHYLKRFITYQFKTLQGIYSIYNFNF